MERRAHFAHYSNRAKPDCDKYFPPFGVPLAAGVGGGLPPPRHRRDSLGCGLFLVQNSPGSPLALLLRLPPMDLVAVTNGRLEIQSGFGHRTYEAADLGVARLVPVAPQTPLATIKGSGHLSPLAAQLAGQVGAFSGERNLFYSDERGGRFIFGEEPLEWGTRYRLLAAGEVVPPIDLSVALCWKPEGKFGGWHSYEMALPPVFAASKPDLPAAISEFVGHRIRSARPRVFVVDPLPHHLDADGTHVYAAPPESLLLRRSAPGVVTVTASAGGGEPHIADDGLEWIQLHGLGTEKCEYTIAIDGTDQVIVRTEACELVRPAGLSVSAGDHAWDLCVDPPLSAEELKALAVRIECGSARIAAHVARLNHRWAIEGTQLGAVEGVLKAIDAGSFGELRVSAPLPQVNRDDLVLNERGAPAARSKAAQLWIEAIVSRDFGSEGLGRLRQYFMDPLPESIHELGPIATSRLMPYIRAIKGQRV